jgi:Tfp pilus assembly PilM family ATPase
VIKELFLPNALFAQEIIGIEIGKYVVSACAATKKGFVTTVQKIATVNIETNNEHTHEEQVVIALKQLLGSVTGKHIRVSLPNNQIFFKEITVPFLDAHKIKMILGYEIESSLPFPLSEAIFDFVIIKQDKAKKESTVLVAIAQKNQINYVIDLINQTKTKLKISAITIDLLGTFGLYGILYAHKLDQYQMVLDLGKTCITISYLQHGQPYLVRNLPYGINSLVTKIMQTTHKSYQDVVENLFRVGLEQSQEHHLQTVFSKLAQDIAFTLNSFKLQLSANHQIGRTLVCQSALEIKNISNYLSAQTGLECDILELNKIGTHRGLILKSGVVVHPSSLPCLIATLAPAGNDNFNLLPPEQVINNLLRYQILTTIILTVLTLGAVYSMGLVRNSKLNKTLLQYQNEAVSELKSAFKDLEGTTLSNVIDQAETKVNREKKIWFSFSNQNRYSALKYLQILSSTLNVDQLNLDLKKLIIKDDVITLQGAVEHDEDIAPLEQALTPVFNITLPQSTNFDIKMTLKPTGQDGAAS